VRRAFTGVGTLWSLKLEENSHRNSHRAANRESAATGKSDAALSVAPPLAVLGAGSGLDPEALARAPKDETDKKRLPLSREPLPLLGSSRRRPFGVNQDSPDPEGALEHPKLQQLAIIYASSCHSMLEFTGFHAVLCRTLLAQMLRLARLGRTLRESRLDRMT
jgi:hypothetical protein